ncbi:6710_t:CDS:2 [Ambispora leptoticha]|uniref:6710_t:CDS:1 n=1 Tax=Ambispora leptoticha TaxID=144679 RepID=A0A9N8YWP0_9GLOM|nr:6710_t:CDS:2 [Ambispora leptoticha]
MAEINLQEYIPTIRTILSESDLNVITAKDVRVKLEERYKVDLTSRKPEVQKLVEQFEVKAEIKEEDTINGERAKKVTSQKASKKTGKTKGRPPKSKQVNNTTTASPNTNNNNNNHATDTSSIDDDRPSDSNVAKKKRGRKPKNATKSAPNVSDDETNNNNSTPNGKKSSKSKNGDATPKKKKTSNKRKKTEELEDNDGETPPKKRKGNTGIHKPLLLSPVLSEFLGQEELSRLEVVKRLWSYIKENNLQDPKDKRFIICDEKLMHIFGKDRMHSFTMNKYLTDHLRKKDDASGFSRSAKDGASVAGGDEEHDEFSGDQAEELLGSVDDTENDVVIKEEDEERDGGAEDEARTEELLKEPASSMKIESSEE